MVGKDFSLSYCQVANSTIIQSTIIQSTPKLMVLITLTARGLRPPDIRVSVMPKA